MAFPDAYHQCAYPQGEPESTPPSPHPPQESSKTGRLLSNHCFAIGPCACEVLRGPFKGEVALFPSPVALVSSSPTDPQNQMLGAPRPSAGPLGCGA